MPPYGSLQRRVCGATDPPAEPASSGGQNMHYFLSLTRIEPIIPKPFFGFFYASL